MQLCEAFTDHSTHVGNLLIAVATAELCNKIESLYMMDQKMFIMKSFYSSGGSSVAMEREYCQEFSLCVSPWSDTVCQVLKQSEETLSVCDKCARRHTASVWMEEVSPSQKAITRSPRKSLQHIAQ